MKNSIKISSVVLLMFFSIFYSCEQEEIDGCMNESACNYNNEATNDDNSCQIPINEVLEVIYIDSVVSGPVGEDLIAHVHIRNSSCSPVSVKARKIYNGSVDTSAYFCFAGVCFSSSTIESPLSLNLDVFEEDDYFKGYFSSSSPGEFDVKYRFFLEDDITTLVEVNVTYIVS
tara:strand:- start:648 stop:1166 length:519 start_codon:yes stop_codon:yes gene_type:complete